ncbi:hypothetical protein [Pannonibacter phragmitetus]|uniref:hypothetical protein n=1 Tax=Pannonibacter phragmitetus TaxID=121719 RepID=UPI0013C5154A|nr:hypothetical protein [Pannonibacter phragmitetus]
MLEVVFDTLNDAFFLIETIPSAITWDSVKSSLIFIAGIAAGQITRFILNRFGIGARSALLKWMQNRSLIKLDKARLSGPGFLVIEYGPSIVVEDDALVDSGECFYLSPNDIEVSDIDLATDGRISFAIPNAFGHLPEEFFSRHASGRYLSYYKQALMLEINKLKTDSSSMKFNGPLYGVRSLKSGVRVGEDERPKFVGKFYRTDYFTFLVVQRMINLMNKDDKDRLLKLNSDTDTIKEEFFPFIPSIGLNAFIFSEDEKKILLVIRSKNAARFEDQLPIYPSMNEALSHTDIVNTVKNGECPSLRRCLIRGFEEELGITEGWLEDIQFTHIAYGTIGVGLGVYAICKTKKSFHEIRNLTPAKDRAIEVSDFIEVDFNKKGIMKIINDSRCSRHVASSLLMIAAARGVSIS